MERVSVCLKRGNAGRAMTALAASDPHFAAAGEAEVT